MLFGNYQAKKSKSRENIEQVINLLPGNFEQ